MREEVCVKHNRKIFFRTWDCFEDRFHGNPDYYTEVTNQIEENENLYFSIKYTCVDFWRRVRWNPCLNIGKHKQIVEIQCQREYEGKGAYPSYVMNDVINGDKFLTHTETLKDLSREELIRGVYVWPRGGGWHGPYVPDEFWSDLNTYVIGKFASDEKQSEEQIFNGFIGQRLLLSDKDCKLFRDLCITAGEAILKGRYVESYDVGVLKERIWPCCNWLRDYRIGGHKTLEPVLEFLFSNNKYNEALLEKKEGLDLWLKVRDICSRIDWQNIKHDEFIKTSAEYACRLFSVIYYGWEIMIYGGLLEKDDKNYSDKLKTAIKMFDDAWLKYGKLSENKNASSLYGLLYLFDLPAMGDTIEHYRKLTK